MNNGDRGMTMRSGQKTLSPTAVESLAIDAFTFIAGDPEHASRFLSLSGFDMSSLRMAAKDPHFLAGVLDYVMTDERLISDLSTATGHPPEAIVAACQSLKGPAPDDFGL